MQILSIGLALYLVFYTFEGLIRYGLNLIGADDLIFLRDALLIIPLVLIFLQQLLRRKVHPAYFVFIFVIVLHGLVMILNIGSFMAVIYSTKVLMTLLVGALASAFLLRPNRPMIFLIFFLWSASFVGIAVDKYYVDFPWMGMKTNFGDVEVEISRDWQITGSEKRAGGFTRSSIYAATLVPLLALVLIFNLENIPLRLFVAFLTVPALVWTTQKGSMIAYLLILGLLALNPKRPIPLLRLGVLLTITLCIALPLILPGYSMPHAEGVFSFSSFYLRVESMWPSAWIWIHGHEIFPFGVGLGGISGAQRLYALKEVNAADNHFIIMYAYFGMMSFVYLGAIVFMALRVKNDSSRAVELSMAIFVFLFGYGIVISMLEDQMASLFLGASIACVCSELAQYRKSAFIVSTRENTTQ